MIQNELTQEILNTLFHRFTETSETNMDPPAREDVVTALEKDDSFRLLVPADPPATFSITKDQQVLQFGYEFDTDAPAEQTEIHEARQETFRKAVTEELLEYMLS